MSRSGHWRGNFYFPQREKFFSIGREQIKHFACSGFGLGNGSRSDNWPSRFFSGYYFMGY